MINTLEPTNTSRYPYILAIYLKTVTSVNPRLTLFKNPFDQQIVSETGTKSQLYSAL